MTRLLSFFASLMLLGCLQGAATHAEQSGDQWAGSPNHAWYEKQKLTPESLKIFDVTWASCCDKGDVCQSCVVHHVAAKPPWADSWWYETPDGKRRQLPPHIVEYVSWTPTGKPVLFIAPQDGGKIKKGDPVCLKVPGGAT